MEIEELLDIIDDRGDLPVIPDVMTKVLSIVRKDEASAAQLADVILKDQSLTTKLLRTANSSFYASGGRSVTSISQAVVVMGFESVRDLAIGISMFSLLRDKKLETYLGHFWVHAVACGVCAQRFARAIDVDDEEVALVSGLLHDVGKMIILRYLPDEFSEIQLLVDQGVPTIEAEQQVIGLRHQEIGEAVGARWKLPPVILRSIRHHHRFMDLRKDDYTIRMGNLVTLANLFAEHHYPISIFPTPTPIDDFCDLTREYLDLEPKEVRKMLTKMRRNVEEYLYIFDVEPPEGAGRELDAIDTVPDAMANAQTRIYELEREARRKTMALRSVLDIGRSTIANCPIAELIERIIDAIHFSTGVDAVALALLNKQRQRIDGVAGVGQGVRPLVKKLHLPHVKKDNLISRVIHDMKPVNVHDVESPVYRRLMSEWERSVWGAPAFTVCPIVSRGVGVGAIIADRRAVGRCLTDDDVELIAMFADLVSAAIERYRVEVENGAQTPA